MGLVTFYNEREYWITALTLTLTISFPIILQKAIKNKEDIGNTVEFQNMFFNYVVNSFLDECIQHNYNFSSAFFGKIPTAIKFQKFSNY